MALARIDQESHGEIRVAAIRGEVDASNVDEIGERLRGVLTNQSEALVVDLGATEYIDSAGINLLFELGAELRQRQQRLHLVVPEPSPIARVVSIAGLHVAVPVHTSREDALRAAAA